MMKRIAGKFANIMLIIIGYLSFFVLFSGECHGATPVKIAKAEMPVESLTKETALAQLEEAENQAVVQGANILVLPYLDIEGDIILRWAQELAEADNLWIIFGADEYVYESVYVCDPTGEYRTYQGMHPEENKVQGTLPLIIDTEYGKFAIALGADLYYVPELARYYALSGCRMVINPVRHEDEMIEKLQYLIEKRDGFPVLTVQGADVVTVTVSIYSEDTVVSYDIAEAYAFKPDYYEKWYREVAAYQKEQQTASAVEYQAPVISVVDFKAVWGDLDANLSNMLEYIEEAHDKGTDIIVFPEMALQGYCMADASTSSIYRLAVDKAITGDGYYATTLAQKAKEYQKYIIFGASEVIPVSEKRAGEDKAYNSAFVCKPDGSVISYKKIHQVEGRWCRYASEPFIVDTEYGKMGIAICKDTYAYPEMARYYAGMGCLYYVNVSASASGDNDWKAYYSSRLENIAISNQMIVISANLTGNQYDSKGELRGWCAGRGCVLGPEAPYYLTESVDEMSLKVGMKTVVIEPEYLKRLQNHRGSSGEVTFAPALYADLYGVLAGTVERESIKGALTCMVEEVDTWEDASAIAEALWAHQEYVRHYTYQITAKFRTPYTSETGLVSEQELSPVPITEQIQKHTLFSEFTVLYDDGTDLREVKSTMTRTTLTFRVSGPGKYHIVEYSNTYDKNHHLLRLLENNIRLKLGT